MASEAGSISISILGRDYQIACPPSEEEALRKSARYLNEQMEKVKSRGSTLSFEKLAIMTALNISHELLKNSTQVSDLESGAQNLIKQLERKIDSALISVKQFEI